MEREMPSRELITAALGQLINNDIPGLDIPDWASEEAKDLLNHIDESEGFISALDYLNDFSWGYGHWYITI